MREAEARTPRVAVLRAPGRQATVSAALERAGAAPVLCPLIDYELPAPGPGREEVVEALDSLAEGGCAWVAFTSATTVSAMAALGRLQVAPGTQVAAVGQTTAAALRRHGVGVDLIPDHHSAVGLVRSWPTCQDTGAATVLLPSSTLAAPTLADGLLEKGWRPRPVAVYATVSAPADPDLALREPPTAGEERIKDYESISAQDLSDELAAGSLDAALLTSPSTTRRVVHLLSGRACTTGFIAIGPRTAAEASVLGLRVDAIATDTTPEALAAALTARGRVRQDET